MIVAKIMYDVEVMNQKMLSLENKQLENMRIHHYTIKTIKDLQNDIKLYEKM